MNKTTELETIKNMGPGQIVAGTPEGPKPIFDLEKIFITAIEKNTPVETMERLLAMRDKMLADLAKQEFNAAMAEFQAACPTIQKHKKVYDKNGKYRYSYAPMDDIIEQVKEPLQRFGFSYLITSDMENPGEGKGYWINAQCKVTHRAGHFENSSFKVPVDQSAFMSEQQKFASALTYAKRYAFCNAFGIMTGDEDNDANEIDPEERKPFTKASESTYVQETKQQTAPEPQKEKPALQPPAKPIAQADGKMLITGKVTDITKAATKGKSFRYKIVLDGAECYYTFDEKLATIAKEVGMKEVDLTIVYHDSKYGHDINTHSKKQKNRTFKKTLKNSPKKRSSHDFGRSQIEK